MNRWGWEDTAVCGMVFMFVLLAVAWVGVMLG